jgi:hypothetical protein
MQPLKLSKTVEKSVGATILNRTKVIIKNDTTTIISNLDSREKLQVKLRYMINRRHKKTRSI